MAGLSISGVSKSFGPVKVLNDVSLDIVDGEFLTILGPSGCGKSTLLKILAGLERQDAGSISLGERQLDGLPPKHRDVAMVFQSYALYPHMTVAENIALPLKMRRLSSWQRLPLLGALLPGTAAIRKEMAADVSHVARALGIDALLDRKPAQLSGGQRQRVAVGRAMVREPAVFLMDEPLSNLDAKLRVQMRTEIKELHRRLGTTFIYVTHDQTEAMTLSDRVVVMAGGEILQVDRPQRIYADPWDLRVAEFVGSPKLNVIEGRVGRDGLVEITDVRLPVDVPASAGEKVLIGIRPETPFLVEPGSRDGITARVRLVEHLGCDVFVHVELPGVASLIVVRLPVERASRLQLGDTLHLALPADQLLVFDAQGRRIRKSSLVAPIERRVFA